jgi:hypothetical protein
MFGKIKNLRDTKKQEYLDLMEEARQKAYEYFDKNIKELSKNSKGEFEVTAENKDEFYNNDVDAFRHAYVSGVFTQVENSLIANLLGLYNEIKGENPINQQNMDLWNNSIGRKYGKKAEDRSKLADLIKKALESNELIIRPADSREYKGLRHFDYDPKKPIKVIQESDTGRNEYFLDLSNGDILDRKNFVNLIELGNYPGYTISLIDNIPTPMSKADGNAANNLG